MKSLNESFDNIISSGYRLEGENEVLIDQVKKEKYKYTSQGHFDKIYKILVKYIISKLENSLNIIKLPLANSSIKDSTFNKNEIYISNDYQTSKSLLIYIPDRGDIHPVVISKSNLFYESVIAGSVIPLVESAKKNNFSVCLMNPNNKKDATTKNITNLNSYDEHFTHCDYVWKEMINGKSFDSVYIVANQIGSLSLIKLFKKYKSDFFKFVKKIILVGSEHRDIVNILDSESILYFESVAVNYIPSNQQVGVKLYGVVESEEHCANYSCGTNKIDFAVNLLKDQIFK